MNETGKLGKGLISVIVLLVLVLLVFFFRLFDFQVVKGDYYVSVQNSTNIYSTTIEAARGEILDRNGIPLATSRVGYNVVIDKNFYSLDTINDIILSLTEMLAVEGEEHNGTLPIELSGDSYVFTAGMEEDISSLKDRLGLQQYATADNVMTAIVERYDITQTDKADILTIGGVRYEMEKENFSEVTPFVFANDVSVNTVVRVGENSSTFQGVYIAEESIREYPNGSLAAHLIGNIGPLDADEYNQLKDEGYALNDLVGKYGVEQMMESELRGTNGRRVVEKTVNGEVVSSYIASSPTAGNTVKLSIDAPLQHLLESGLAYHAERIRNLPERRLGKDAEGGSAVVVEVKTGKVLAMANYPSYDLNQYYSNYEEILNAQYNPLFNRALTGTYVPGSVFKPIVASAALEKGTIDLGSRVTCNRIYTYFENDHPTCLAAHGSLNVVGALRESCNIFFYDVGRRLGIESLEEVARSFGIGELTGIDEGLGTGLVEKQGTMAGPTERAETGGSWYVSDTIRAAIGQSDTLVTPISLASYVATLANSGVRNQLSVLDSVISYDQTQTIKTYGTNVLGQTGISEANQAIVRDGMIAAANGYGLANGLDFEVAAKTGTAQDGNNLTANFICYAPAEDPEIAIEITLEKGGYGSNLSPFVREILQYYFNGTVPSYAIESLPETATFSYNTDTADQ